MNFPRRGFQKSAVFVVGMIVAIPAAIYGWHLWTEHKAIGCLEFEQGDAVVFNGQTVRFIDGPDVLSDEPKDYRAKVHHPDLGIIMAPCGALKSGL